MFTDTNQETENSAMAPREVAREVSVELRGPVTQTSKYQKIEYDEENNSSLIRSTSQKSLWLESIEQFRIILQLGIPNCVEKFTSFLPGFILIIFLGHLGPDEIAGAGMGFMFGNVTGISVVIGFALGLPPLASQAFGASNFLRCGELLQRQITIHLLVVVPPVIMMWLFAEPILVAFKQPHAIAKLAGEFLFWRLPALPFIAVAEDLGYFLKAQRVMVPTMILMLVLNMLSVGLAWLFISPLGLGFKGGPIALTVTNIAQCIILCAFAKRWLAEPQTWPKWSVSTAMAGWREILAMSLPAALGMWAEWWAFELTMIFSGWLCVDGRGRDSASDGGGGNGTSSMAESTAPAASSSVLSGALRGLSTEATCIELDVTPILMNTMAVAFFMHFGYSVGASTHVGNLMGSNRPAAARVASVVTLALVVAISGGSGLALLAFGDRYARLFTDDPEVLDKLTAALPIMALYMPVDAIGIGCLNNLLRAINVVNIPAALIFGAIYGVGIPLGLVLTFGLHWGLNGLWVGLLIGAAIIAGGLVVVFGCVDWQAAADAARRGALDLPSGEGRLKGEEASPSASAAGHREPSLRGASRTEILAMDTDVNEVEEPGKRADREL